MKILTFLLSLGLGWGIFLLILGFLILAIWYVGFQLASQLEGDSELPLVLPLLGVVGAGLEIIGFLDVF